MNEIYNFAIKAKLPRGFPPPPPPSSSKGRRDEKTHDRTGVRRNFVALSTTSFGQEQVYSCVILVHSLGYITWVVTANAHTRDMPTGRICAG